MRLITRPDVLLFQGGTAQADAEAGVDPWHDLLTFLDDAKTLDLDHRRWRRVP